mmetsp:Transcript_13234/g.29161  ORF Transcript_13234/g.29161 Transcript_13234/m.29161 type:complete len:119 (-) Transcript_13234:399-755(-)|eukprot:CAMPEP_0113310950 /NCGR_PEP_ID=MMETSP0010_2-20120614/8391_1 /TAXON_ID=216773 ORGANISM="Corethron hystrix, Strain 308" /NCGR_SAMPLE_ID=MMETSP0010_2 /ASSEMBLY_ACC=CAM_ASM_000155 /LENGTH=118 /DNA_ID=CAMNT_0000166509 /DNA_START=103 /DNA_END=459 /DNA_ORIENTATION=+ /assembly_acc=CAM_ASM_000155
MVRVLNLLVAASLAASSNGFAFTATSSHKIAFSPLATSGARQSTELSACRINAKKEKRQRNRDNMRKFQKKRGSSRRKMMKKLASNAATDKENEFVGKLFMTMAGPEIKEKDERRGRY